RLTGGRGVSAAPRPIAPAMPRPIHQDDAIARGKPIAERHAHVREIAAGAVQLHDGSPSGGNKLREMQPPAGDLDEASSRRMLLLDAPTAIYGQRGEPAEH